MDPYTQKINTFRTPFQITWFYQKYVFSNIISVLTEKELLYFYTSCLPSFAQMCAVFPPLASMVITILENLKKMSHYNEVSNRETQDDFTAVKKLNKEIENCFDLVLKSVQSNNKLISTTSSPN